MLEPRFAMSRTIPSTRKLHSIIPASFSETTKVEKVMIQTTELEIDACDYDSRWWLAFVLGVDTE